MRELCLSLFLSYHISFFCVRAESTHTHTHIPILKWIKIWRDKASVCYYCFILLFYDYCCCYFLFIFHLNFFFHWVARFVVGIHLQMIELPAQHSIHGVFFLLGISVSCYKLTSHSQCHFTTETKKKNALSLSVCWFQFCFFFSILISYLFGIISIITNKRI